LLRASEWIFIGYFSYVALIATLMRPEFALRAFLTAAAVACVRWIFSRLARLHEGFDMARDWLTILYLLMAYREMNWFTPPFRDYHFEKSWILWDRLLLDGWNLRGAIESLGPVIPNYLELCYLLVYGILAISLIAMYWGFRRNRIDRFLVVYLSGTLLSYMMFPFFPSDPPRVVFPNQDLPGIMTTLREINLFFVGNYGIHSSVFPSAHVSSAFAAAWGLMRFVPEHPWIGRAMLIYAVSVSVATVYGRYHYAPDALAGFGVGLVALFVSHRLPPPR
jgi:membrane-associated phospholipid phosphatase